MELFLKMRKEKALGRGEIKQRETWDSGPDWVSGCGSGEYIAVTFHCLKRREKIVTVESTRPPHCCVACSEKKKLAALPINDVHFSSFHWTMESEFLQNFTEFPPNSAIFSECW